MVDLVAVNNFGDTRSGGLAGPMGLLIILLMSIATVLLIRNMNKHLRRLPDSFEQPKITERDDEIARLDADLRGPDARPDRPDVDRDRFRSSRADAEAQVSDLESGKGPTDRDGRSERA